MNDTGSRPGRSKSRPARSVGNDAEIHGDRKAALQALLLDPVVNSYSHATQMLDDLLKLHAAYVHEGFGR